MLVVILSCLCICMLPWNAVLRLWSLVRQVFIERDGELEFVGLWSDVESLNECEALPPEVKIRLLRGNNAKGYIVGLSSIPYIPTFVSCV